MAEGESPWTYMTPLLTFKGQDKDEMEASYRQQFSQSRLRYDVLSGVGSFVALMYIWLVKFSPTGGNDAVSEWRTIDHAAIVFEAASRLLPPLAILALGRRRYSAARAPIFIGLRGVRLARMVYSYAIKESSGIDPTLRCTVLRPTVFDIIVSANLTTFMFHHVMTVHSVPMQMVVLSISSWLLARDGGVCDALAAGLALPQSGPCQRVLDSVSGVARLFWGVLWSAAMSHASSQPDLGSPQAQCRVVGLSAVALSNTLGTGAIYVIELRSRCEFLRTSGVSPALGTGHLRQLLQCYWPWVLGGVACYFAVLVHLAS